MCPAGHMNVWVNASHFVLYGHFILTVYNICRISDFEKLEILHIYIGENSLNP